MVPTMKSWVVPTVLGVVVSGAWAYLSIGARDGLSGPTTPQIFLAALALLLVIAWRTHMWTLRRVAGSSFPGLLWRGAWEGMVVGTVMGAAVYALAAVQDGTPVVDFLILIVLVGWALVGGVVFLALSTLIGMSTRRRTSHLEPLS